MVAALAGACMFAWIPGHAGVPHVGDMTEYKMPGYTLIAADNGLLRKSVAMLPRLRRTMERVLHTRENSDGIPTYIVVVSGGVWDRYLQPSPVIPSEFVPTRFANYILASNTSAGRINLFHDYSHLFLRTRVTGAFPLWFDEGMAMVMSNAHYSDRKAHFLMLPTGGVDGNWIHTDRLLRVTRSSPEYLLRSQTDYFHFQSTLMFQRAMIEDPEFGKQVMDYVQQLNELKPVDEAVRASFHVDAQELDAQMRGFLSRSLRHSITLDIGEFKDEPLGSGRKLSNQEALLAIATVAIDTGFGVDKAHELLDKADAIKPASSQTPVLRLRLAARRGEDVELERLYDALQPRLAERDVARTVGLAFHQRVLDVEKHAAAPAKIQLWLDRTLELLKRSLSVQPDDPEAVWSYAMAAAALKRDLGVALQRIEPIVIKMPRNPDIAQAAALLLEANGNRAEMRPFLQSMYHFAPTFEQKRWAANCMAETRSDIVPVRNSTSCAMLQ